MAAVTTRSNRSKSEDQDRAEWLPSAAETHCRSVAEWVGAELRWSLSSGDGVLRDPVPVNW
ncbi:hypothetical protein ACGFOM_28210 [Streptomyces sp. NPDC048594]|uniref:hypothetical protein n=1 Tax=Streptomyces sp. NPDC048594 TaxID=3365575 RepID=UPI003721C882